ncbi:hypothetical protein EYC80_004378 [Monilinia laxa]|uniref:Uncharacterized protein n=1 Tax=Monilinia laxa TaxID=61186 RepID=A0A5N6KN72_MONLA|nr:hypothetical protein EYC80_004378 [Monilinia laxa]
MDGSGSNVLGGGPATTFQFRGPANLPTLPTHPTHPTNSILTTPPTEQASAHRVQAKLVELQKEVDQLRREKAIAAKKVVDMSSDLVKARSDLKAVKDDADFQIAEKTKFFNALVEANDNNDKAEETIAELTVSMNTLANGKANVDILNRRLRDSVEALRENVYDLEDKASADELELDAKSFELQAAQEGYEAAYTSRGQAVKSLEESEEKVRLLLIAGQSITDERDSLQNQINEAKPRIRQLEIEASQVLELVAQNSELATKNEQLHALIRGAESNFEVAVQGAAANLVASNSGETVVPVVDCEQQQQHEEAIAAFEAKIAGLMADHEQKVSELQLSHRVQLDNLSALVQSTVEEKNEAAENAKSQAAAHFMAQGAATLELSTSKVEISSLDATINSLRSDLRTAQESAAAAGAQVTTLRELLRVSQESVGEVRLETDALRTDLGSLWNDIDASKEALVVADRKLAVTNLKLLKKETELAEEQTAHKATKSVLNTHSEEEPRAYRPHIDSNANRMNITRLLRRDSSDEAFEKYTRKAFNSPAQLSLSSITAQETEPLTSVNPIVTPYTTAGTQTTGGFAPVAAVAAVSNQTTVMNVTTGTQTTEVPAPVVEVAIRKEEMSVAIVVPTTTRSSRFSFVSWSNFVLCFLLMMYLVGSLTNLDGSPALRQIALIDAPPARVISVAGTSTTDTPVFVPSNYVEAYRNTTASSIEVPASTEVAAVPKHDYLPQVFYSFRMPRLSHTIVANALEYWKRFEGFMLHRLEDYFSYCG